MFKSLGIFSWVPQEIKQFVKDLLRPVLDFIKELLKLDQNSGDTLPFLVFAGACLVGFLLIIIIVSAIAKSAKNKKAKKLAKKEEQIKVEVAQVLKEVDDIVAEEEILDEEVVVEQPVIIEEEVLDEENETEEEQEEIIEEQPAVTTRVLLGKFEVFPIGDAYLYRLKASNGELLVVSEMYKTANGALSAIETVKRNVETGNIQIHEDKHGLYQFKLFAANKRLLVASANYTTYQSCENASNSFKKFAEISPVSILDKDPDNSIEEVKLMTLNDKKNGKIWIVESDGEYEFQLKASNGVLLCTSASYKTKASLVNSISLLRQAVRTGKFYVMKDKNDMYQFKLYNEANRCIVVGEAYKTKAQAISAANSVATFVPLAEVVDKTIKETV